MVFTDVHNDYILLYGGVNLSSKTILNDAFIYINEAWRCFDEISNQPNNLIGAKVTLCG